MVGINATQMLVSTLVVTAFTCSAQTQDTRSSPEAAHRGPSGAQQLDAVKVTGSAASTPSDIRQTLSEKELRAYGSRSLADALAGVPGISILGNGRGEKEITIDGMGGGYTLILINGEQPPRGFSLDAISVDMIEKVEIIRSARADMSAQAVAGTINVVLRKVSTAAERSLSLSTGIQGDRPLANASYVSGERGQNRSWSAAASYAYEANEIRSRAEALSAQAGAMASGQLVRGKERPRQQMLSLSPRLSLGLDAHRTLTLDGTLQAGTFQYRGTEERERTQVTPFSILGNRTSLDSSLFSVLGSIGMSSKTEDIDLSAKLALGASHRSSDGHMRATSPDNTLALIRDVDGSQSDQTGNFSSKIVWKSSERHAVSAGVEGQAIRRTERRGQREESPIGLPTEDMDDDVSATILRQALFVQDEWSSDKGHTAYAGIRWEGVGTRAGQRGLAITRQHHTAVSPVFQTSIKLGGVNQIRFNVGRTYRMPNAKDLIPRKWVMNDNSPTTPNFIGNPELRPEMAWTVGSSYDTKWSEAISFNIGATYKAISDVVLQSVTNEYGVWTSRPVNFGSAKVLGIFSEMRVNFDGGNSAKFSLQQNNSRMPGGRALYGQPKTSIAINSESKGSIANWGAALRYEQWSNGNPTLQQTSSIGSRTTVDVFASRAVGRSVQARIAVTNLFSRGRQTLDRFASGDTWEQRYSEVASPAKITVGIECKL